MIGEFRGEHFFLSNMYRLRTPILSEQGIPVWSSEHAYQAAKFADPVLHRMIAESRASTDQPRWRDGVAAKQRAQELEVNGTPLIDGWYEGRRIEVMASVIRLKFAMNPELAGLLIATGDEELIEGNNRGDSFWGVVPNADGEGENHLGLILMEEREHIRSADGLFV